MSRLYLVFGLLAVIVVPLSYARPHKCEQRERSLADLELAEDSLNRAKQLYPNCEEGNESSNSSECSKKDKSLGFIDVALDLVSNAKKNIPICPHDTTVEPLSTTEEPLTITEEPLSASEEPLTMTEEFLSTTEEPLTMTEEPTPEVTTEGFRAKDCQDLLAAGIVTTGVYTVWPLIGNSMQVRCDMDTDGGGWTVIQRRGNFTPQEKFSRIWQNYKVGFGNLEKDFWLGNDNIFALSNQGNYSLRMDMTAVDGESAYSLHREFRIEDKNSLYKLHVGGYDYDGTAGDCMSSLNGALFTTKDRKNDHHPWYNCAGQFDGGFWYYRCASCSPNGKYNPEGHGGYDERSMHYHDFKGYGPLLSMEMKIKRLS